MELQLPENNSTPFVFVLHGKLPWSSSFVCTRDSFLKCAIRFMPSLFLVHIESAPGPSEIETGHIPAKPAPIEGFHLVTWEINL